MIDCLQVYLYTIYLYTIMIHYISTYKKDHFNDLRWNFKYFINKAGEIKCII